MKNKRLYASGRIGKLRTLAVPSEHLHHAEAFPRHQPLLLYGRESSRRQSNNLEHQISQSNKSLKALGFTLMGSFGEIAPGWINDRTEFSRAVAKVKEMGGAIAAEATNRFCRNRYRNDGFLSVLDMERLLAEADGVPLVTLLHPDTPEKQVRRYQTKRGQTGKDRRGGRPKKKLSKKQRRIELLPTVLDLWNKGSSKRHIARNLGLPLTTVWKWIEDEKMERPEDSH